jgi:hypothetical protein
MIIGLASPCTACALDESLDKVKRLLCEASAQGAEIVCFPEAYLPGLRGQDFEVLSFDTGLGQRALLREGDDNAQPGEYDLLCQCQLCSALPRIGNMSHHPIRPLPGVLTLWAGRRIGAGHQPRGGNGFASHSIRTRALSRIQVRVSGSFG